MSAELKPSFDQNAPKNAFKAFLERAENDGWIASYKWHEAETFGLLRQKLKGPVKEGFSRSHKKGTDGHWWGVEVEAHFGTSVGIDLEILISRPILDNPSWITQRLNIARTSSPKNIIEEWSVRESAFKALSPDNDKIVVSQFRKTAPNTLTVYTNHGDKSVQTRATWAGKWMLSLAWRTTS